MAPTETKSENDLTIEQLAAETGITVRNIRSHRARGLLPAPEVRDRVGYYGPEHLDRLKMIQELQGDGFNLKGIERLLSQNLGPAEQFISFKREIDEFDREQPQTFTRKDLADRFGTEIDDALKRAIDAGRPGGDRRGSLRGPLPLPARRRRGRRRDRRPARSRPRRDRQGGEPLPVGLPRVRQALPRGHLEALRRGRATRRSAGPRSAPRSTSCARSRCRRWSPSTG